MKVLSLDFKKFKEVESLRLLSEAYVDYAPSISTCEDWFRRFKVEILIRKTKSALANWKSLKTKNWRHCWTEKNCHTKMAVSKRLKSMGMARMRWKTRQSDFSAWQRSETLQLLGWDVLPLFRFMQNHLSDQHFSSLPTNCLLLA